MVTAPGRLVKTIQYLGRDPGQLRYLPTWATSLRHSTVEAEVPWLPYRVLDLLEAELGGSSRVFEFGGGGSTLWFSRRAGEVVTVEHDEGWARQLSELVASRPGCSVIHRGETDNFATYVGAIDSFPEGHFDVVVVDGRERVRCAQAGFSKVKPGGVLILDDTNRDRYRPVFDLTDWPSVTYAGLTPTKRRAGVTTVWRRPLA